MPGRALHSPTAQEEACGYKQKSDLKLMTEKQRQTSPCFEETSGSLHQSRTPAFVTFSFYRIHEYNHFPESVSDLYNLNALWPRLTDRSGVSLFYQLVQKEASLVKLNMFEERLNESNIDEIHFMARCYGNPKALNNDRMHGEKSTLHGRRALLMSPGSNKVLTVMNSRGKVEARE